MGGVLGFGDHVSVKVSKIHIGQQTLAFCIVLWGAATAALEEVGGVRFRHEHVPCNP